MFSPFKVADFQQKILSIYTSNVPLNAGGLVDIDPTNTSAVGAGVSVGYTLLTAGSLKLATITPSSNGGYAPTGTATNALLTANFGRELGVAIPNVSISGPTLTERILELASSYMTVPAGAAVAVLKPCGGDIIATTEYVGYLPTDTGATGLIDITNTANYCAPCGIYQGRFRLVQTTDAVRARYLGNTTVNGALVGLFEFFS
jgi:hypothetical protein